MEVNKKNIVTTLAELEAAEVFALINGCGCTHMRTSTPIENDNGITSVCLETGALERFDGNAKVYRIIGSFIDNNCLNVNN